MLQRGLRWLVRQQNMRSCLQALAGQSQLPGPAWMPAQPITVSSHHFQCNIKDHSFPNASWSPVMVGLYNEFMEKSESWRRIPGYPRSVHFLKEEDLAKIAKVAQDQRPEGARIFLRITEMEKLGFEYVIFHNNSEGKCVCLFQPGPFLEGLPGIIHGGALATMIDTTFFMTAFYSVNVLFTGTMSITFKSPICLGTVLRLETKITGMEGRKLFLSCEVHNSDRTVLFAEASAIFIQTK